MDAESIDAIVSDPPYGLGFMGMEWDHGVPGEPFWAEALRRQARRASCRVRRVADVPPADLRGRGAGGWGDRDGVVYGPAGARRVEGHRQRPSCAERRMRFGADRGHAVGGRRDNGGGRER